MKGEPEYPSPEEFVRASHGLETEGTGGGSSSKVVGPASSGGAPPSVDLSNHVSAFSCLPPPEIPQGVDMNMSLLQMMASGTQLPGGGTALAPGKLSCAWDSVRRDHVLRDRDETETRFDCISRPRQDRDFYKMIF